MKSPASVTFAVLESVNVDVQTCVSVLFWLVCLVDFPNIFSQPAFSQALEFYLVQFAVSIKSLWIEWEVGLTVS